MCESSPAECDFVDKENTDPVSENLSVADCNSSVTNAAELEQLNNPPVIPEHFDHVEAANKLSQDASNCATQEFSSCQYSTSGTTTCNGSILKRRRDNINDNLNPYSLDSITGCSVNKKSKLNYEPSPSSSPCLYFSSFTSELSDYSSSEDSDSESECDLVSSMQTDSPQISNLVNIFNTGFSGLCDEDENSENSSNSADLDNELDISSPPQYTLLTKVRPESPNSATLSRKLSDTCANEAGRLDSLPSGIILSA